MKETEKMKRIKEEMARLNRRVERLNEEIGVMSEIIVRTELQLIEQSINNLKQEIG